jgi:hypothetical protein
VSELFERLLADRRHRVLAFTLVVNAILIFWVGSATLQRFPNSGDEYAYLLSAELFAGGKLALASPEPRGAFRINHVLDGGRTYGKYPPAWPAFLAIAVRAGAPWAANLVLGLAAVVVIYLLARRHFSVPTANLAVLLAVGCPFLVFNSASLYAHPFCLLFLALAALSLFECLARPDRARWYPLLGLSAGLAFAARPFTAVVALAPLGVLALVRAAPGPRLSRWRLALLAVPPLLTVLGLFFLYNRLQTGSFWLQPFQLYDPTDTLGFHRHPRSPLARLETHVVERLLGLTTWAALTPLLLLPALQRLGPGPRPRLIALLAVPLALLSAHYFYWGQGWNEYGPRYLYESLFALLILAALGVQRLGAWAPLALALALGCNAWKLTAGHAFHAEEVRQRREPYRLAAEQGLDDAIVFIGTRSGTMLASDLARNGTRFDGPVIFARDRGSLNAELVARHPGRRIYRFAFDPARGRGRLLPYDRGAGGQPLSSPGKTSP